MKSRLFTDPQGLDEPFGLCAPDKVSVCVQMDREAEKLQWKTVKSVMNTLFIH